MRTWAFFRRLQYGGGLGVFVMLLFALVYVQFLYSAPTCFDESQNGEERGVDCGGACTRICAFEVSEPNVKWARSFRVNDGQYNAVAYVENQNRIAATPELSYTFELYDADGLITQRKGTTILPPDSVYPIFEGRIDTGGRVPTQTFITIDPIELWLPADQGRDQFTVTDRKLANADVDPRLDAKIYNTALTEAEDVEVVATIFDANGNALTSSRTIIDEIPPRSEVGAVFTWPEPIAGTIRSCEVPTDIVMGIDLSGSMNNDQDEPPQPITSVLTAARAFVDRLQNNDQVGVVTFATEAQVASRLSGDVSGVASLISMLFIDPEEEGGSTNTGDAILLAEQELNSELHSPQARRVFVLLTDGLATAPDEEPEIYALTQAQMLKDSGVEVYTIGLGEQVNMDFVTQLASSPLHAYRALSANDVDRIYQTITASLCEDGAAVIDIVPKTDASFAPLE